MSCGVGWRGSSDPELLWIWCRPAATAPIRPLPNLGTSISGGYTLKRKRPAVGGSLQTINAGDGVEKRELSYTIGGNVS